MKKLKLKSKIFLSFLVIFGGYYLYSYHSENTKYEILNEILSDMDYNLDNVCIHKAYVDYNKEQFEAFSFLDIPSVYSQYSFQYFFGSFLNFREWGINKIKSDRVKYRDDSNNIHFSNILSDCSVELKEKKENGHIVWTTTNPTNTSLSLPILSSNGKIAIIQFISNCGMLCGSSHSYLFKKIDGKWKLINKNMSWIS